MRVAVAAGAAAWFVAVTAGFVSLFRYSAEPGALEVPPIEWPAPAGVALDPTKPTLVLFAHPHCPCTRATIAELDRLMARCAGGLAAHVLFYSDPGLGEHWERSALWEYAASIPGVRTLADPRAETARTFHAATSGSAMLYGPDGRLLFHGGITAARGHEGDSPGATAIADIVAGSATAARSAAVYGCALFGCEPEGPR